MWSGWVWLLYAGIVASFGGCTAAAQRAPAPSSDLTGVWIGNFTFGCVPPLAGPHCLIRQDISFTFVQHQATDSGFYQCSFRDHPCIAHQHGGRVTRIDNTRHVLLIKVRMDDGSSCTFGATAYKDNEMSGGCICFEVKTFSLAQGNNLKFQNARLWNRQARTETIERTSVIMPGTLRR